VEVKEEVAAVVVEDTTEAEVEMAAFDYNASTQQLDC
jgi:hypothetical protein